jgi:transposase-like protein
MADIINRDKALALRHKGYSIGDISKILNKQKSTISYWCKNVTLTTSQINKLSEKSKSSGLKAILLNSKKLQEKRKLNLIKYSELGKRDLGKITDRDLFILGIGLYWGEGYKKGNDEFGFTNSDPTIIKTMIKFLNNIYNVSNEDFILRVSINKIHKTRERDIVKFWSKTTKTSSLQFTKTSFIKSKPGKQYQNNKAYYGTLRIKVRNGANLRRRILGSINNIESHL